MLVHGGCGGPPWRRRWNCAVPAVAVVAIAVSIVAVGCGSAGSAARPVSAASAPVPPVSASLVSEVPEYYVALPGKNMPPPPGSQPPASSLVNPPPVGALDAVVGDTFSGKVLATVPAPAGSRFLTVAAAGDDRTFIVGASGISGGLAAARWYLIRLTPGAAPFATLRELPVPGLPYFNGSVALSPDGTQLAVSSAGPESARVYSTVTGALLHTWPTRADLLSWTSDGRQLAFETQAPEAWGMLVGIRLLPADDRGHGLNDSRLVWSAKIPNDPDIGHSLSSPTGTRPFDCGAPNANGITLSPLLSVLVSGDGTTLACGASGVFRDPGNLGYATCPAVPAWNDEGVLQYSTATGKPTGTLYQSDSNCAPGASPVQLLWISDSGNAVLGYFAFSGLGRAPQDQPVLHFGLFTPGKFTPLPAPPTLTTDPLDTAW